ncbi:MAG: mechanosensitive ion channel [Gammaproteobacteria bacterium]|nr:mechanosensitive ion channel [Gammaproteobacteria bacterium]MBV8404918.1 mechanosensitive ion channel [Gammaproteobacteria bacterium]
MSGGERLWHLEFLGNELGTWLISLAIFLVTFTVLPLVKRAISAQRRREPSGPQGYIALDVLAAVVAHTNRLFLWGAAVWLASRDLSFPDRIEHALNTVLVLLLWMQLALWAMAAIRYGVGLRRRRIGLEASVASMDVILVAIGIVVWGLAGLLALENLGIHVGPLLAGLGIGGIAIALAVQTVLADLLASLAIALDKPFGIGDALTIDDCQGTVEHIGVKSTRLRSLTGEQIILGNSDLLKARVRNFGRLMERRSLFLLDVHYDTPVAALAAVPGAVREIIEATPDVRFDRCHLLRCLPTALQYEAVFFVTNPDYKTYANAQQSINLRILERLRTLGVTFVASAPTPIRLHRLPGSTVAEESGQQRLL